MCAGPGSMKISVLAHQIITTRSTRLSSRNRLMSSRIALSMLRLLIVCIVLSASMRLTYSRSNAAGIGLTSRSASLTASMCLPPSSTPARVAATYASSGNGSHAPKTMSSSVASGRKSLMSGRRLSVRLPRRIVPIWVSEPTGALMPRLTSSTPAISVDATAPRPTVSTPSRPSAGAIVGDGGVAMADQARNVERSRRVSTRKSL